MKTALLVVDVQNALIKAKPYHVDIFLNDLKRLIFHCRKNAIEVIFVRHHDDDLKYGSHDWEIFSELEPSSEEKIIDKTFNSAFRDTELRKYLDQRGISQVIITGMQTELCIDATIKVAFEFGYKVIVPKGLTSTFDNRLLTAETLTNFYETIWHNRYAQVKELKEILNEESYD